MRSFKQQPKMPENGANKNMGNNPYRSESRTLAVRQNNNGWFLPALILIIVAGLFGGAIAWMMNGYQYTHHKKPAKSTLVDVFNHSDLGQIGMAVTSIEKDSDGDEIHGVLVSEVEPTIKVGGDWVNAKWVPADNDRKKMGRRFAIHKDGRSYFPPKIWVLKK